MHESHFEYFVPPEGAKAFCVIWRRARGLPPEPSSDHSYHAISNHSFDIAWYEAGLIEKSRIVAKIFPALQIADVETISRLRAGDCPLTATANKMGQ